MIGVIGFWLFYAVAVTAAAQSGMIHWRQPVRMLLFLFGYLVVQSLRSASSILFGWSLPLFGHPDSWLARARFTPTTHSIFQRVLGVEPWSSACSKPIFRSLRNPDERSDDNSGADSGLAGPDRDGPSAGPEAKSSLTSVHDLLDGLGFNYFWQPL